MAKAKKQTASKATAAKAVPKDKAAHSIRQKNYSARQKDLGLYRATAWIPAERKDDFDKVITRMRKKWDKDATA